MHSCVLLFYTPGPFELVVILVLALVLFGNRIPSVARSMGRGITEFKKGLSDSGEEKPDQLPEQTESAQESR
jgi:sec-independent protein translocase protein TatA